MTRFDKKRYRKLIDECQETKRQNCNQDLHHKVAVLVEILSSHFHTENSKLFPVGMQVIEEVEWKQISRQFDELGYCRITPKTSFVKAEISVVLIMVTGAYAGENLETDF